MYIQQLALELEPLDPLDNLGVLLQERTMDSVRSLETVMLCKHLLRVFQGQECKQYPEVQ